MFWEAILLGLLFGWLRKGDINNFNKIDLRGWTLIGLALLIQGAILIDFNFKTYYISSFYPFLYTGSFVFLLTFIYLHRNYRGLLAIGTGILLNLIVIIANNGLMPVDGTIIPPDVLEALAAGNKSPFHTLMNDNTVLKILGDRFSFFYRPNQLLSIGDLVIAVGVFVFVQETMLINNDDDDDDDDDDDASPTDE